MNLTSNRRADEFNRLLDSDVRSDDPVTGPLLAVGDALRELPSVEGPRPEFRAALRQRLVAVATVQGVGTATTPIQRAREAGSTWRVQRRLTALAAGAAVVTGVAGVAVGASRSLPGDPFYGVKRASESAQLAATVGTEARGKRHLEFARTRLHEVEALAGTSSSLGPVGDGPSGAGRIVAGARAEGTTQTKLIADTLCAMDVETRSGANDLFEAFRDSASREPLHALNAFTREQYVRLQALVPALPAADQEQARASLTLLTVVATDTVRLAGTPVSPAGTTTPTPSSSSTSVAPQPSSTKPAGTRSTPSTPAPSSGSTPPTGGGGSLPTTLPTGAPSVPAPSLPAVPTIPAILPTESELPTVIPSLPDITGLLGH